MEALKRVLTLRVLLVGRGTVEVLCCTAEELDDPDKAEHFKVIIMIISARSTAQSCAVVHSTQKRHTVHRDR